MKAGPLGHPVAYELPPGIDASISFYFVSDEKGVEAKITIDGVNQLASGEHMLVEAERVTNDPQFIGVAKDWRLMTRTEVLDYRRRQREEDRADYDRQGSARAGAAEG